MTQNNITQAELEGAISYERQRDWFDPTQSRAHVMMIGCGGIGSPTALALAKLGIPRMTLVDPDTVEAHNIPNQLFPLDTINLSKVGSLKRSLTDFSAANVTIHQAKATATGFDPVSGGTAPSGRANGIVVSGLDSMEARIDLWKQIKFNINVPFFVDARLGGENVVIYTLNPRDTSACKEYEESLHTDEDSLPAPCTRRSIIDVGFAVASLITRAVRRHLANERVEGTLFWNHEALNAMHD